MSIPFDASARFADATCVGNKLAMGPPGVCFGTDTSRGSTSAVKPLLRHWRATAPGAFNYRYGLTDNANATAEGFQEALSLSCEASIRVAGDPRDPALTPSQHR